MKKFLIVFMWLVMHNLLIGCFLKSPSATMTKDYLEVVRPGDNFAVVELKEVKLDSVLGYPIEETPGMSFTPLKRRDYEKIDGNESIKIKFAKKYKDYCWRIFPDPFFSDHYYRDTIAIKANTWYRVTTDNFHFSVYYFFDSVKQSSITKLKPFSGAW